MCHYADRRLGCDPAAVSYGRGFIVQALRSWGADEDDPSTEVVDDVLLAASELLTNAILVCANRVHLHLRAHVGHIEVAVIDDHPGRPELRSAHHEDTGGRGLYLVEAVSERWGHRDLGDGTKEVWCRLSLPPHSALGLGCAEAI